MKIVYCQSALTARVWKLRRCRIMTTIWEINWSSCTRKSMSLQRTWKNLLKKLKNWKQSFIRWRSVIRQQEILQKLEVQPIQAIVSFSKIPRKKLTEFKKGNPRNLEWTRKNWGRSLIFFLEIESKTKKITNWTTESKRGTNDSQNWSRKRLSQKIACKNGS